MSLYLVNPAFCGDLKRDQGGGRGVWQSGGHLQPFEPDVMRDQNHHKRLELLAPAKNPPMASRPSTTAPMPSTWGPRLVPAAQRATARGPRPPRHAHRFGAQVFVAFNTPAARPRAGRPGA